MRKRLVFACLVLLLVWPASVWAAAELSFAGYQWQVKDGYDYPGKNHWSSRQAWVDEAGALHLRLEKRGLWYCAEVISREYFSYGRTLLFVECLSSAFRRKHYAIFAISLRMR